SYISPHTTGHTRPRMRSVNTPVTPTTRETSTQYHISPLIRRDAPGLVWGLSTRWLLLRHVRPQHNIIYLPSYDGTHPASYGVYQHAGYSYDTCDLTQHHNIRFGPGYILTSPHGTLVLQVWSRSDGRIAHDRTGTKTLTLWLAFSEYPGLHFTIRRILYDLVAGIGGRKPAKLPSLNQLPKRRNLSNLTQQTARTARAVQDPYLDRRKWWPEVVERVAESSDKTRLFFCSFRPAQWTAATGNRWKRERRWQRFERVRPRGRWW
ncbi:unnamed protein product, partial [Prunus brigantina]